MGAGTIVGVLCGFVAIFGAMIMEGGNPASLIAPPALLLIIVGTFGAATAGMSLEASLDAVKTMSKAFTYKPPDYGALIDRLAGYAEQARRDGLLALESVTASEPEPLLARGMSLAIDGFSSDDVKHALAAEAQGDKKVWKRRADFWSKMGGYAPTLGIIGTVLGLIHTLESLGGDPSELGELIAAAFIATFFGVMFANILFLPLSAKMTAIGEQETLAHHLVIEGVLALAGGVSPRNMRETLSSGLDPAVRGAIRGAGEKEVA